MKIKFNVGILCAVFSILFLFACGGGGGGNGVGPTPVSGGGAGKFDDGGNDNGDNKAVITF